MKKQLITIAIICLATSVFAQNNKQTKTPKDNPQDYWVAVERNGLVGYIDGFGKEVVEAKYNSISSFGEFAASWALVEKDGLLGFIDKTGAEVVEPKYEAIDRFDEFKEHWALVQKNGLLGFIDLFGKEVVEPKYDAISPFGNHMPEWALIEKDGLLGFIDKAGEEVVKPMYETIDGFKSASRKLAFQSPTHSTKHIIRVNKMFDRLAKLNLNSLLNKEIF